MIGWMRRLWRWLRWVLLVAGLLVGGWLIWTAILRHRFETRLEALREAGEPVDPADLEEPRLPEADNAAPLLRQAAELIGEVPEAVTDPDQDFWTEEELADAREWVASKAKAIDMLHRAAARPGSWYPIDWSQGPEVEVVAIPWTQRATHVLNAHAKSMAKAGRAAEALRSVETMFRIGNHLPRATAIAYLVRLAVHAVAIETLQKIAREKGFDPAAARERLGPLLDGSLDFDRAVGALGSVRFMMLSVIRRWIRGESPRRLLDIFAFDPGDKRELGPAPLSDWIWSGWIARPLAYKDGLLLLDEVERRMGQLKQKDFSALAREAEHPGAPYFFSALFRTVAPRFGVQMRRQLARVRVARIGLVALAARQRTGRFPRDLALPLDPFTKEKRPLRYEIREDGSARIEARAPIPAAVRDDPEIRKDFEIAWELE